MSRPYDGHNPLSINNYGVHDLNYVIALGDTYRRQLQSS